MAACLPEKKCTDATRVFVEVTKDLISCLLKHLANRINGDLSRNPGKTPL